MVEIDLIQWPVFTLQNGEKTRFGPTMLLGHFENSRKITTLTL